MPGQIKRMLDEIVGQRAKGNPVIVSLTTTKLILKGVNPEKFNAGSPDDPNVISRVRAIALELGISLS